MRDLFLFVVRSKRRESERRTEKERGRVRERMAMGEQTRTAHLDTHATI